MTNFQVIWQSRPWDRLHEIANCSANPAAVANAYDTINQSLGNDPHRNGMPLSEGLFRFDARPLRVFYSIDSPRRRVIIRHVIELP